MTTWRARSIALNFLNAKVVGFRSLQAILRCGNLYDGLTALAAGSGRAFQGFIGAGACLLGAASATAGSIYAIAQLGQGLVEQHTTQVSVAMVNAECR